MRHDNEHHTTSLTDKMDPWPSNAVVLKEWAKELKRMHFDDLQQDFWRLLGRAPMIIHHSAKERKRLVSLVSQEAGLDLVDLECSDFLGLVLGGNVPLAERPTLFCVEQGEWSNKVDDDESVNDKVIEFREKLSGYLSNLDSSYRAIFAILGASYERLDKKLRKVGCIDRRFIISKSNLEQSGLDFVELIGRSICGQSLKHNLGKVGKLIFEEFDDERRQGLVALALERIASKENRKVEFSDLLGIAIHGSGEFDEIPEEDEKMLHRVAVHEAGHALVCFIDSFGSNIPDYVSVVPSHQFSGVVADSYTYMQHLHGKYTYEDSRHKIRSTLGGRAAEEYVFGSRKVGSFGARADLINASNWAKELVSICGFPSDIDTAEHIGGNLLVLDGDPSPSECSYIEAQARNYLLIQYNAVRRILKENSGLLHALVAKLQEKPVLFQEDLEQVFLAYPAHFS